MENVGKLSRLVAPITRILGQCFQKTARTLPHDPELEKNMLGDLPTIGMFRFRGCDRMGGVGKQINVPTLQVASTHNS